MFTTKKNILKILFSNTVPIFNVLKRVLWQEESERGLRLCGERNACAVLLHRYWRADALVRLCRCPRRRRCDSRAPPDRRIELNNRAYFQVSTNKTFQLKLSKTDFTLRK
ncbi:unnamed protein product [Diatraea saccharalis]|uniref:Uncharacterized protein n=1 Tax=Diatraea saccharalis TaxID=40085 RepID=A0A9N9WJA0_9NEOP|nr:unnamed protein product [Diatraea saccharalis]